MGLGSSILGFGERALGIGAELGVHALDACPLIGSIPAAAQFMYHGNEADQARWNGIADDAAGNTERSRVDHDQENYYRGQSWADAAHAIPFLGAGLEFGEVLAGGYSAVTGGSFEEGMDRQRDGEIEALDWMTGTPAADVTNRTALRHRVEEEGSP